MTAQPLDTSSNALPRTAFAVQLLILAELRMQTGLLVAIERRAQRTSAAGTSSAFPSGLVAAMSSFSCRSFAIDLLRPGKTP